MKNSLFLLSSLCLMLVACETSTPTPGGGRGPGADNAARNVRERVQAAPGQMQQQAESEMDRTITQRIRQALMEDENLSTNAKNIRVAVANGVVTLRGMVNSDKEKNEIARKVRAIVGVRNIDNQIEARGEGREGQQMERAPGASI